MENKYDWFDLEKPDEDKFRLTRDSYHLAIQSIAAVGRSYGTPDAEHEDAHARLYWIPGLWRIAGTWINGSKEFRSSISLLDHHIYLVDPKLNTLDRFSIIDRRYHELMLWLEQQIIRFELSTARLSTDLPYLLSESVELLKKQTFSIGQLQYAQSLGGHFQDAYILFREIAAGYEHTSELILYPHRFDMEVKIILKKTDETATDTFIRLGFSPGDEEIPVPYFYINSWPNITGEKLPKAPSHSYWSETDRFGLVQECSHLYSQANQKEYMVRFLEEGLGIFRSLLLD